MYSNVLLALLQYYQTQRCCCYSYSKKAIDQFCVWAPFILKL